MGRKKKHNKTKGIKHPRLPVNASFWLEVTKNVKEIKAFVERGNALQKGCLKAAIEYRLWQIQEKAIPKDFFGNLNVKKLDLKCKAIVDKPEKINKSKYVDDYEDISLDFEEKPKKVKKAPIDLFDIANIQDLVKEKI